MGLTWLVETVERHQDRVAHHLMGRQEYVRVPVSCPVAGCGWTADALTGDVSLADHLAMEHPVGIPRLLIGGEPARAVQVFKHLPQHGDFSVVGGHLDFRRADQQWRSAADADDLVDEMRAAPRASDWTVRVRAPEHEDLEISYRIRLRVIADEQMAAIDEAFLQAFRSPEVGIGDVLAFRSQWGRAVVEEDYAGCLADAIQFLVLRGSRPAATHADDPGPVVRRLATYAESIVSSMLMDILRFCSLDVAEGASQDLLLDLALGLDTLHAVAASEALPRLSAWPNRPEGRDGVFVDEATADLLDRVATMMTADEGRAAELASDLVAWSEMPDRRPEDRDKALTFAILGCAPGVGEREVWASRLVHHPLLGRWARGVREGGGPE